MVGGVQPQSFGARATTSLERSITRLVVSCPDQPGIVAAISQFLYVCGANIVHSDQHTTDPAEGTFFMRMEFHLPDGADHDVFAEGFASAVAARFGMEWRVWNTTHRRRIAVMASRADHCLLEILWRWRRGDLDADIACVISNHEVHRDEVERFAVPYHVVPCTRERRREAETCELEILRDVDLVVLARYMQILSGEFLEALAVPVINIHHSMLPAFAGADPHTRARERGVKLIGATAHYVTEVLDEGPIIEQDVIRVSHRVDAAAMRRLGADIERTVLARAVQWHLEDRVILHDNTTVVF